MNLLAPKQSAIRAARGVCLVVLGLLGCDRAEPMPTGTGPPDTRRPVTVFAASSTADVLEQLAARYQAQTGVTVACSFASSSTLARQIAHGARADLFVSADPRWLDDLARTGRLEPGTPVDLMGNRLVLIQPRTPAPPPPPSPPLSPPPASWPDTGLLAMGDPDHVPAGVYGKQALAAAGWWDRVAPRLVPTRDARAALKLVETGQTEWGLVYTSDAAASDAVRVVHPFEARTHPPIRYTAALIRGGASPARAAAFLDYLLGGTARDVFAAAGFAVHGAPPDEH